MDLIIKIGILVLIVVGVISVGWLFATHQSSSKLTQSQAEQLVLSDVKQSNQNATVSVVSVTNSTLEANSWQIILSVIYNGTRPCPTLFIEGFDYPATGLVPSTDNLYTEGMPNPLKEGCTIYGLSSAPSYVISSPEVAIARSYNSTMAPQLYTYVNDFGYNNTVVHATFYPELSATATPTDASYSNVWIVNYSAVGSGYNDYVILAQSGHIVANYTLSK